MGTIAGEENKLRFQKREITPSQIDGPIKLVEQYKAIIDEFLFKT